MENSAETFEKQLAGGAALRFVYPGIRVNDSTLRAETVAWALLMARALDRTSLLTYGAFEFYRLVATGALKGALTWTDIAVGVARSVYARMKEGPQKNRISESFIHMQFSQVNLQRHLEDPDQTPLTLPRISADNALDRYVWGLSKD